MGKASFTSGFAKRKLAEGRCPVVGKIETEDTTISFETSVPKDLAWSLYRFVANIADGNTSPQEAFKNAFEEPTNSKGV